MNKKTKTNKETKIKKGKVGISMVQIDGSKKTG